MKVKTFDVASSVIEEANKRFSALWQPDGEKYKIFEEYCGAIDGLIEEFGGESVEVEVDETNMGIRIQIEVSDMTIESPQHKYFALAQRAVSFGFAATESGAMAVEFVFPSIWVRKA